MQQSVGGTEVTLFGRKSSKLVFCGGEGFLLSMLGDHQKCI